MPKVPDSIGIKISELGDAGVIKENDVVPINAKTDAGVAFTKATKINDLRQTLGFENAFLSVDAGLDTTVSGDIFFVYESAAKLWVLQYQNNSGVANPILGYDNNQVRLPTARKSRITNKVTDLNGTDFIPVNDKGGSLTDTIVSVYVDAFGADPTGKVDSTSAILMAISAATEGIVVSNYSKKSSVFVKIIFGNGRYQCNNIPIPSGVEFVGQGELSTICFPTVSNGYVFTTIGTTTSVSDPEQRLANAKISEMTIGCGYWTEDLYSRPSGTGGIYIKSGTYCTLSNLRIARLSGCGLRLEGMWDSDFSNVKIVNCGSGTSLANAVPGLYIGNAVTGTTKDPSNALRFRGLQIENCVQNFYIDNDCRHITFDAPKVESSEVSIRIPSIIGGVRQVSFNSAELTWQYQDAPMIRITNDQPHFGITFNNPRPISTTNTMGWYFDHLSTQIPMSINAVSGFAVWKLITGRNFKLVGGEIYNSGPCLVDGTSDILIMGLTAIVSVATISGNGADDVIRVNGGNVKIIGNDFYCAGTVTDGSAVINLGASTVSPRIKENSFRGTKNIGIRVVSGATLTNNSIVDNLFTGTYGGGVTGGSVRYSVTSKNSDSGFGDGNSKSFTTTIAAGSSLTSTIIAGGTDILIKTFNSSGVTCAKVFADYQSTALNVLSTINGIKTGTGAVGDGFIYLTKSGTDLTITNYTTAVITVYVLAISAQA